jgi:hypothetical protein
VAQFLERELRADPELAGIDVQGINAAVNFNRIVEVTENFIKDGVFYEPDIVVVGGSANNFAYYMTSADVRARRGGIQMPHPWELEFQRRVNRGTFVSLGENTLDTLDHYSATTAVARKIASGTVDGAFSASTALAWSWGISTIPTTAPPGAPATFPEFDQYVDEYLGYADALVAVATRHHAAVAFFWEYLLGSLGGIKPMSADEATVYGIVRRPTWEVDKSFDDHARDRVRTYCDERGVTFVDPLEELRRSDDTIFIDYLHYTAEGNRFMAHVIYDRLKNVFHERARALREERRDR